MIIRNVNIFPKVRNLKKKVFEYVKKHREFTEYFDDLGNVLLAQNSCSFMENKILVLLNLVIIHERICIKRICKSLYYDKPLTFDQFCKKFYIFYFSLEIYYFVAITNPTNKVYLFSDLLPLWYTIEFVFHYILSHLGTNKFLPHSQLY